MATSIDKSGLPRVHLPMDSAPYYAGYWEVPEYSVSLEGAPKGSKYRDVTGEQGRLVEVGHNETKDSLQGTDGENTPPFFLQDFLRGIPLKLLSCDLFEEWMGALEKPSEEDRIEALKQ